MADKNFIWIVFLLLQLSPVSSFWLFSEGATGANANLTEQRHVRLRRQQPAFCKDLKKENKVQEIVTSCTKIFALSEKYKFDVKDEPTGWENFAKNVISMDNIDFVFDGSSLKTIAFPQATVKSSSFTVKNNQQLTSFKITSETFNAAVTIVGNPILDTVVLEGEGSAKDLTGGELRIDSNPKLTTVDMDTLTKIAIQGAVSMNENGNLKTVKLGSLATFTADSLNLEKNAVLEKFELPKLASSAIKTVTVAQNRLLSKESIDGLNKITGTKTIQAFGECKFDTPIKDLSELNGCVEIIGDVSFASPIAGNISPAGKLKNITGNVNLNDLDPEKVVFLSSVTISGTITSTVCDFKLGSHTVASPTCPPTTTAPPTTEPATPPATAADKSVTSSGQDQSSGAKDESIVLNLNIYEVIGIAVGIAIVIIIVVVLGCVCYLRKEPPYDDKNGEKVRMYKNRNWYGTKKSKPNGKKKASKKSNNSKNSTPKKDEGKKRSSEETKSNKETKKSGENPNSKEGGTKSKEKASKEKVNGGSNENAGQQGGEGAGGQQRNGAAPEQGQQQGGNSAEQVHPPVGAGGGAAVPVQSPGDAARPGQQGGNPAEQGQQGGGAGGQEQQGGGAAGQEQQGGNSAEQVQQGGNSAEQVQQGGGAAGPGQQGGGAVGQVQAPGGGAARQAQQRGNPGARKIPTRG